MSSTTTTTLTCDRCGDTGTVCGKNTEGTGAFRHGGSIMQVPDDPEAETRSAPFPSWDLCDGCTKSLREWFYVNRNPTHLDPKT